MRGKDVYTPSFTAVLRITPAYAGKRQITVHSVCSSQDHPRLCGEKSSMVHRPCKKTGSPPPMRGKEFYQPYEKAAVGITPAYAGKRCYNQIPCPHSRDHPRLCGEKYTIREHLSSVLGSPPPMRGKVSFTLAADIRRRITPAYAGKSRLRPKVERDHGDHPRLCGEKRIAFTITSVMKGSPPPMRGKVPDRGVNRFQIGITPAYAGKSSRIPRLHLRDRDHPRLCGEKSRYSVTLWITAGSPPPMRGKE